MSSPNKKHAGTNAVKRRPACFLYQTKLQGVRKQAANTVDQVETETESGDNRNQRHHRVDDAESQTENLVGINRERNFTHLRNPPFRESLRPW